jgi:hypothetical protein
MEGRSSLAHEGSEESQYHDSQEEVPQLASEDSSWPLVGGCPVHRAHVKRRLWHQLRHGKFNPLHACADDEDPSDRFELLLQLGKLYLPP